MGIQHPLQPGASLRILASSGEVVVTAEERDDPDGEPPGRPGEMKDGGRTAEVKSRSGSLRVRCPKGTDVSIGVISGHVQLAGQFGSVKVSAVSGHIRIGRGEKAARVSTLSGSVELGTAGEEEVVVKSISGGVTVRVAEGKRPHIKVRTLSGKLRCDCPQGTDFDIKASTSSGSVEVTGP